VKNFVVLLIIIGFLVVGAASVLVNALRDGLIRYSTIRLLILNVAIGPAASILNFTYVGYVMQKVKKAAAVYEFK
jgi:hypothetical protein